jgi:tetratricopeptide (TPR) repeat protein
VSASLVYLQGLGGAAHGDLELAREIGQGYWRVARIQGVPMALNLGERAEAEASLKKADEFADRVLAGRPKDHSALYLSALIANDRMILAVEEHRRPDALVHARQSAARLDAFLSLGDVQETERADAALRYGNIAIGLQRMRRYADAIPYARREEEVRESIPSARVLINLGLVAQLNAQREGDLEGELQLIEERRKAYEKEVYPSERMRIAELRGNLLEEATILGGDGEINLGRPTDAIHALQRAFDLDEEAARMDPADASSRAGEARSGIALADILRPRDPKRALGVYDLVLRRLSEIHNSLLAQRDQALALANSSYALRKLGRASEARQRIDAALAILTGTKDYPAERYYFDSAIYTVLCALADQEADAGDPHRAIEKYEQLLKNVMAAGGADFPDFEDAPRLSRLYDALAGLYRRTGETAKADSMQSRGVDLWQHWGRQFPNNTFVRRQIEAASR